MQALFQDTKEIRAAHLSKLGSASYGSQVRRLLGAARAEGPPCWSVPDSSRRRWHPGWRRSELLLWNRTPDKARELARRVQERHPQRSCRVLDGTPESELEAWSRAGDVIVCVPADPTRDAARIAAWRHAQGHGGRIVHLGLGEVARFELGRRARA